jgi:DNA (cytosine-5)-methyltransferase 1
MHSPHDEVRPHEGRELVVGSVCTGYGGLDLGVLAALGGGRVAWVADPDPHVRAILAARMPGVPNLGDITAVDWDQVEPVDVLTAGFPCQDISAAGRRAGIEKGHRSGLWTNVVAGIRALRPALVVVENVAALRWKNGGLHKVLGDLAEAGYDALWRSVRAADVGAAHRRERVFLLAWRRATASRDRDAAYSDSARRLVERNLGGQPARRSLSAGPLAAVADSNGGQPERRRGDRALVGTSTTTPGPQDQREWDGDAALGRGAAVADPDHVGRAQRHAPVPRGRAVAARRSAAAADAAGVGHRHGRTQGGDRVPAAAVATGASAGRPRCVPADATGNRRDEGLPGTTRLQRGPDAALGRHAADSAGRRGAHLVVVPDTSPEPPAALADGRVDWGPYTPAVRRWEQVLGRHVPFPTQPGRHGGPVLAPAFVEWLQGLEPGWVTNLPLPRTAQLRALGNGVVPQQAAHAVGLLLDDLAALVGYGSAAVSGECAEHRRAPTAA